jgi:hypothetical protein
LIESDNKETWEYPNKPFKDALMYKVKDDINDDKTVTVGF